MKGTMRGVGFDRCNRFSYTTAKFKVRPDMMDLQKPVDEGELSPFYQLVSFRLRCRYCLIDCN